MPARLTRRQKREYERDIAHKTRAVVERKHVRAPIVAPADFAGAAVTAGDLRTLAQKSALQALTAPEIEVQQSVGVFKNGERWVLMANPQVLSASPKMVAGFEASLKFPQGVKRWRSLAVRVAYYDLELKADVIAELKQAEGRAFQQACAAVNGFY